MAENKPTTKVKVGTIEVTGWNNEKDGKKWVSYQVQRSYKVGDEWKQQKITLNHSELPKMALALNKAFDEHYKKNSDE